MNKNFFTKQNINVLFFNRWSRNPYAAFSSLKAVVKIGFLTSTLGLLAITQKGYSQTDTIKINNHLDINEVVVSSNRTEKVFKEVSRIVTVIPHNEIQDSPAQTLQDLLRYAMNVDIRQRGANGVQADVSIRGGSFEQTLFLLNSIPINDPQTGHHNLNIPIDFESIDRIEILSGPGARIFGPNAFSGAINIITDSKAEKRIRASISGGQWGLYSGNAAISYNKGNLNNYLSVGINRSNGYHENTDFNSKQLFYHASLKTTYGIFDLQTGYLNKSFGANSFYSPKYPNQFEQIRNLLSSIGYNKTSDNITFSSKAYWRRNHDRFELFREDKFNYQEGYFVTSENDTAKYYQSNYYYPGHNYHLTDVMGINANMSVSTILGTTSLGFDYRNEHIYSNVLGSLLENQIEAIGEDRGMFTKEAERNHFNVFVEQDYNYKKLNISFGGLFHFNSEYGGYFPMGMEASYWLTSELKIFASVNQAVRMPTFTDLYYDGPDNNGNPNLKPEKAICSELGLKGYSGFIRWTANGFIRDTKDAIDWVKKVNDADYTTTNYTQLYASGLELSARINFKTIQGINSFVNYLNLSYNYTNLNKETDSTMVSAYSLDYLRHKINISADHTLYKSLGFSWNIAYQNRNGAYTNINKEEIAYTPFMLVDTKIYWREKKYEAFIEVSNLLNTNYYDLGGIIQPGRWIRAGVKINIEL